MGNIIQLADALMQQLFAEDSWGGTEATFWSLVIEDVQSLNPDRIAKSLQIVQDAESTYWNSPALTNMAAFLSNGLRYVS